MAEVIDLHGFRAEVNAIAGRLDALQERAARPDEDDGAIANDAVQELQQTVEELQVSQEELAAQNEALTESRAALEDEHARYRALFLAAPVPYVVTDLRGVVRQGNAAAIRLLNVDDRFLVGKPLAGFVGPAHRQQLRRQVSDVLATTEIVSAQWDLQPRRRPPVPAAFDVAVLRAEGVPEALLWLIRDLSAEKSLAKRADALRAELLRQAATEEPGVASEAAVQLVLADLGSQLLDEEPLEEVLQRVAEAGRTLLPMAAGASVSVFEQGRPRATGISAPWVQVLDERQYDLGEGPSVSALSDGQWHAVDDLDEDPRWPRFSTEATEQGVLSAVAVPLLVRGARLGVLTFYASSRGAFSGGSLGVAQRLAGTAAVLIANAQVLAAARRLSDELQQALTSRSTVDMAKGVLIARLGINADQAFEALRDLSQRRHVKLRDVAADLLASPRD